MGGTHTLTSLEPSVEATVPSLHRLGIFLQHSRRALPIRVGPQAEIYSSSPHLTIAEVLPSS